MNWLNFHHLLYFREIVVQGSLSKASEALLISPPALSAQLKLLEENLGQQLFERQGRNLVLNEFGKQIFKYCEKIHTIKQDIIFLANNDYIQNKKNIKIGIADGLSKTVSKDIVIKLKNQFKDLSFSINESDQNELTTKLLTHDVDIIFTNRICSDDKGDLLSKEYNSEKINIYGTKKHLKLMKNFPHSLNGASFIMPSLHSDIRHLVDQWFIEKKIKYNMVAEIEDSAVKKLLAAEGIGLVPLPEKGAKESVKSGKLYKIGNLKGVSEKYYFTVRRNRKLKNELLEFLISELKN